MKIFVAGATGALGKQLVPRLVANGHEVVGLTRSASKVEILRSLGATPVVGDALDPEDVARAVAEAEPEVIVHQLTALAGALNGGEPDQFMAFTNRLRIEATDHLLAAGRAVGVRRFVAQSYAGSGMPFARTGGPVKNEDDPIDSTPPNGMRNSIEAIRHLEAAVTGAEWTEGIVLRYGSFYGPGTALAGDGEYFKLIRQRKFPLVGSAAGVWSFIHIGRRVASCGCGCPGRTAPLARAALGWTLARRRSHDRHDDRSAWRVKRQGQARTRLAPGPPHLAPGIRRGGCMTRVDR
jgi:nucleoside-diphosphate-sugar epimerase